MRGRMWWSCLIELWTDHAARYRLRPAGRPSPSGLQYWREAPRIGLTGVTQIKLGERGVIDARRQRIIVSRSQVNLVKWSCLFAQAVCALLAIAMVHSDNRLASSITMGIFATGVAASVLLIASHDRPFIGEISVGPDPLLQVMPEAEANR
jgi:hypothetical protein